MEKVYETGHGAGLLTIYIELSLVSNNLSGRAADECIARMGKETQFISFPSGKGKIRAIAIYHHNYLNAGILACLDGYMNIAMEQTEEYVNGQLKNKYGDAFIRGNNVLYISTSKRTLAEGA
nr:U6 snRNA-associated Sm-like protein LSm6 [Coffea arabica]